jgi:hypothetical protein
MNAEQIEFVREHGITYCPPSLEFRVVWYAKYDDRVSEAERIASFSQIELEPRWVFTRGVMGNGRNGHGKKEL